VIRRGWFRAEPTDAEKQTTISEDDTIEPRILKIAAICGKLVMPRHPSTGFQSTGHFSTTRQRCRIVYRPPGRYPASCLVADKQPIEAGRLAGWQLAYAPPDMLHFQLKSLDQSEWKPNMRGIAAMFPATFRSIVSSLTPLEKLNLCDSRCLNNKAAVYFTHHHLSIIFEPPSERAHRAPPAI
jgi:hypothetical protein